MRNSPVLEDGTSSDRHAKPVRQAYLRYPVRGREQPEGHHSHWHQGDTTRIYKTPS